MTGRTSSNCHEVFVVPLTVNSDHVVMILTVTINLWPTTLLQIQIPEFLSN